MNLNFLTCLSHINFTAAVNKGKELSSLLHFTLTSQWAPLKFQAASCPETKRIFYPLFSSKVYHALMDLLTLSLMLLNHLFTKIQNMFISVLDVYCTCNSTSYLICNTINNTKICNIMQGIYQLIYYRELYHASISSNK